MRNTPNMLISWLSYPVNIINKGNISMLVNSRGILSVIARTMNSIIISNKLRKKLPVMLISPIIIGSVPVIKTIFFV